MNDLPKHIAIVMDGNGRWARRRKLPRIAGHRAGGKIVRKIVESAASKKVQALTLFAFSTENRNRPKSEVHYLMSLFLESLENNTKDLHENNIRLRIIGDHRDFDKKLLDHIDYSQRLTEKNTGLNLTIAINYSGRWDITRAATRLAEAVKTRKLEPEAIDIALLQSQLCLSDLPDPDLLIRTSAEQRISNFMLWQFAYTEMYFPEVYWPDFNEDEFEKALLFYETRQRRFGLTSEQVERN